MTVVPENQFFELAPIAMWLEDFSEVHKLFEIWRAEGVTDIRAFLSEDPERVVGRVSTDGLR